MGRATPTINWQVLLKDDDWNSDRAARIPAQAEERNDEPARWARASGLVWKVLVVSLAGLVIGGYFLWQQAQAGLAQIERELQTTIGQEMWLQEQRGGSAKFLADLQVAAGRPKQPVVDLLRFDLNGDLALAEVVVTDPDLPMPYRETRFYRQAAAGWTRATPDVTFLGSPQRLETEYIHFRFYQRDWATVAAVAGDVNALYRRVRADLGLTGSGAAEPLSIEITVTERTRTPLYLAFSGNQLTIPSPRLLQIPIELTAEEVLFQSIAIPLVERMLRERLAQTSALERWQSLKSGVRLWLLWEGNGVLSRQQNEVVAWVYRKRSGDAVEQQPPLPGAYRRLCQVYSLWEVSLVDIGIPLVCFEDLYSEEHASILFQSHPPSSLRHLSAPVARLDEEMRSSTSFLPTYGAQAIALATLIDYAVQTYGRDRLPVLLTGLHHHNRWETFIPAVFGVSSAEFERGWQRHLEIYEEVIDVEM